MRSKGWLRLLVLAAISAVMVVAVACGDDDDDDTDPGDTTPGATQTTDNTAKPKGGEITMAHRPFGSFDPHYTAFGRDISQQGMVFRGMYRLDKDDKLQPELAEGLPKASADGKTYTVAMKSGLKWSDGAPMTIKDFVNGILRTCNPDVAGQYSALLFNIAGCEDYYSATKASAAEKEALMAKVGVKATGELSAEITLNTVQPTFPTLLALWFSWPIPSHVIKTPGAEWPKDPAQLVFSGPFKVQSFKEKDNMVLLRNDNYGGGHVAYLDKITIRYIENLETANNAYRGGELQMSRANTAALDVLRADSKLGKELAPQGSYASTQAVSMNAGAAPLNNPKLRLALSQATDRVTLNKVVLKEANVPTTTWIPVNLIGVAENPFEKTIGYNPDQAKKTYAESGAPQGLELKISVVDSPADKDTAAFLQEQWGKILGVKVQVEVLDSPSLQKLYEEERHQIIFQGWSQDFPDAENWVDGLFNTGGSNNHYGCSNPKLDDLYKKAKVNLNETERKQQYVEMNRLIAEEICGVAPIYHQRVFYLIAPKLKGAKEFSSSQDRFLPGDWAVEEWYLEK